MLISQQPAEADDRAVPGHWEGDLLIGLKRSAIGTLAERTTRVTMLVHLPREDGFGVIPRTKNAPALVGYGAVTSKDPLASTITTLPEQLRRSVTWDQGKEMPAHAAFKVETGVPVSTLPILKVRGSEARTSLDSTGQGNGLWSRHLRGVLLGLAAVTSRSAWEEYARLVPVG